MYPRQQPWFKSDNPLLCVAAIWTNQVGYIIQHGSHGVQRRYSRANQVTLIPWLPQFIVDSHPLTLGTQRQFFKSNFIVVFNNCLFNSIHCVIATDRQIDRQTDKTVCLTPLHACTHRVIMSMQPNVVTLWLLYSIGPVYTQTLWAAAGSSSFIETDFHFPNTYFLSFVKSTRQTEIVEATSQFVTAALQSKVSMEMVSNLVQSVNRQQMANARDAVREYLIW